MKKIILLTAIITLIFSACKTPVVNTNNNRPNRYLPELLGDIVFKMPLSEVQAIRTNLAPVEYLTDAFSFRKEFVEEINQEGIKKVIYYFDTDEPQVFYEVIIVFDSEEKRDAEATRLLGQENFQNNTEWMIESRQNFKVHAWKFEKKLVVAALLPGTEWGESAD